MFRTVLCSYLWKRIFACLISWLGACLQVRLRLPSLRTRAAQHPHTHTHTHTLQTQNTHASNTTQQKQKLELTMGGCAPPSSVRFLSAVLCLKRVCVLCLKCVCVCVGGCCAARVRSDGSRKRTCRQAPSQEIRQANIRFHKSVHLWSRSDS